MLRELAAKNKVIGVKQSRRAIRDGKAALVLIATDADPALLAPIEEFCREKEVPCCQEYTMDELGRASGIHVGAAVVAVLNA